MTKTGFWLGVVLLALAGCADTGPVAPAEGRKAVILAENPEQAQGTVRPAAAVKNANRTMAGYNAQNKAPVSAWNGHLDKPVVVSAGKGITSESVVLAAPVILGKTIYTLDSRFVLQATNLETGKRLGRQKLADIKGTTAKSVGLATDGTRLYAVAGDGRVMATDLSGNKIWEQALNIPLRSAPVIADGRLYVSSLNNELVALAVKDGTRVWSYNEAPTTTNFFGMGAPAAGSGLVVMPTTNGRINALDAQTGVLLWTETVWAKRTFNTMLDIPHIVAAPVIADGQIYVVGNAGKAGAWRLNDGAPIFEVSLGGRQTPIVSGNVMILISNQNQMVALDRRNGRVFWQQDLTSDTAGVEWYGPAATDRGLIATSSAGDIVVLNPANGQVQKQTRVAPIAVAPVVAGGRLVILTQEADILIYQ